MGTHDVFVTVRDSLGRVVTVTSTGPGAGGAEGRVHYHVAIDTAALAGTQGLLAFQFNPGAMPLPPGTEARITGLSLAGGTAGSSTIDGSATLVSSSAFTLTPTASLNRLVENVTLGARIEFDLELVGPGLAQPASNQLPAVLAVQLLSANGLMSLLSSDSSASILRVNLSSDGSTNASSTSAAVVAAVGGRATVPNAPINLTLAPFTVQEGLPLNGTVATFTNGNPLEGPDALIAQISWGDGSSVTSGVISGSRGSFTVTGSHVYQKAGSYSLDVTVIDPDGVQVRASAGRAILAALTFKGDWGQNPNSVPPVSGDFNGDGILNVAVGGFKPVPTNSNRGIGILSGRGDGSFQLAGFQATDQDVTQLAVGDFNNDGKLDVVAAISTFGQTTVELLLGNGDGTLQPPIRETALKNPGNIAVADLTGDGNLDLIYTQSNTPTQSTGSNMLEVALGNGDGTFHAPITTTIPGGFQHVYVADMNGDGIPDVILATYSYGAGTSLEFLRGLGNGSFAAPTTFASGLSFQASLAIQDYNGDGKQDVAVVDGVNLDIFSGNGDDTFSAPRQIAATPGSFVVSADFNADGRPDLAVSDGGTANDLGGVRVFINTGAGNFAPGVRYTGITRPSSMLTGDFDHDGHIDIAISGSTTVISVLPGLGDGTFASAVRYASGLSDPRNRITPQGVATADLTGDGHTDAVLVMNDGRIVTELGNGDGTFKSIVSGTFDGGGSNGGGSRVRPLLTDINHDGRLDVVDAGQASGIRVVLGSGNGAFPTSQVNSPTRSVGATVLADFNHDGRLDVASVYPGFNTKVVGVSLANADGTFQKVVYYPTGVVGGNDRTIAVGDFRGNGKLDLVVANESGTVSLLLGNGDGTFAAALNTVVGIFPFNVGISAEAARVGDFNGDGKLDIVTAEETGEHFSAREGVGGLTVLLGNGDGTFQAPVDYFAGVFPMAVTLGDFNHDGRLDIAAANFGSDANGGNVSILIGNPDGTFQPAVNYNVTGAHPRGIVAGDLNGDGKLDVVTLNKDLVHGGGAIAIWHNNGNGTFALPVVRHFSVPAYDFFGTGLDMAVGDLNGDGRADVVVSDSGDGDARGTSSGGVSVLLGVGDGTLAPPVRYLLPLRQSAYRVTLADLNRDGRPEIITLTSPFGSTRPAAPWPYSRTTGTEPSGRRNFTIMAKLPRRFWQRGISTATVRPTLSFPTASISRAPSVLFSPVRDRPS